MATTDVSVAQIWVSLLPKGPSWQGDFCLHLWPHPYKSLFALVKLTYFSSSDTPLSFTLLCHEHAVPFGWNVLLPLHLPYTVQCHFLEVFLNPLQACVFITLLPWSLILQVQKNKSLDLTPDYWIRNLGRWAHASVHYFKQAIQVSLMCT